MKGRRRIPAGMPNGVYQIAARDTKEQQMSLTEGQIKAYEAEGFVPKVQISDETAASQHRALFNELEAKLGREECAIGLVDRHFEEEFIWEIATHPKFSTVSKP